MKMFIEVRDGIEPKLEMEDGVLKGISFDAPFILIEKKKDKGRNEDRFVLVRVGETRPCSQCGEERYPEQYYISSETSTGYQNTCIVCYKRRAKNADE